MNKDFMKFPIEYPLIDALKIYAKRISVFFIVIIINFILLLFFLNFAKGERPSLLINSLALISLLIFGAAVAGFFSRLLLARAQRSYSSYGKGIILMLLFFLLGMVAIILSYFSIFSK